MIDFKQMKQSVIEMTPALTPEIADGRSQISEDTDSLLSIWCEYYSLRVKRLEEQDVLFKNQNYGINFEYQFWFDIYTVTPNWLEGILSFVGKVMQKYKGDCVLESNGDIPIVIRKNGIVTVDNKLHEIHKASFNLLKLEYQEEDLKNIFIK
jgi:hypothetical protein